MLPYENILFAEILKSNARLYIFVGAYFCRDVLQARRTGRYLLQTEKNEREDVRAHFRVSGLLGIKRTEAKKHAEISGPLIVSSSFHPSSSFRCGVCSAAKWHPPSLLMNPSPLSPAAFRLSQQRAAAARSRSLLSMCAISVITRRLLTHAFGFQRDGINCRR